jgi:hypothetical protein
MLRTFEYISQGSDTCRYTVPHYACQEYQYKCVHMVYLMYWYFWSVYIGTTTSWVFSPE